MYLPTHGPLLWELRDLYPLRQLHAYPPLLFLQSPAFGGPHTALFPDFMAHSFTSANGGDSFLLFHDKKTKVIVYLTIRLSVCICVTHTLP